MTIANIFTLLRVLISPLFLLLYVYHESIAISSIELPFALLVIFCIAESTDAIDGYLARKYNQVTDLGKILDPMADSIYRISLFLTFTLEPVKLPLLLVFIFFYRDSMISTLRTLCALNGFAQAARPSGKIKAILQAAALLTILLLMIPHALGAISTETLQNASFWVVSLTAVYTVYSGYDYFKANVKCIKNGIRSAHGY